MSMADPSILDTAAYHIIEDDWLKETTVGLVFSGLIDQMCWKWKHQNIIRKYLSDVAKKTTGLYGKIWCTIWRDFRDVTNEKQEWICKTCDRYLKNRYLPGHKPII